MQVKGAKENSKKKVDQTKMPKGEKQRNSLHNKFLAEQKKTPKESAGYSFTCVSQRLQTKFGKKQIWNEMEFVCMICVL